MNNEQYVILDVDGVASLVGSGRNYCSYITKNQNPISGRNISLVIDKLFEKDSVGICKGDRTMAIILPSCGIEEGLSRDEIVSISGKCMLQNPAPRDVVFLQRGDGMADAFQALSHYTRRPQKTIVAYLGWQQSDLLCLEKKSKNKSFFESERVSVSDLVRKIIFNCEAIDEECGVDHNLVINAILKKGGQIDTGGLYYDAGKDILQYCDLVCNIIKKHVVNIRKGETNSLGFCLFGLGATIINLYTKKDIEEELPGRWYWEKDPWIGFLRLNQWNQSSKTARGAKMNEQKSSRKWIRFSNPEVLNIVKSLPNRKQSQFIEEAISCFFATKKGRSYFKKTTNIFIKEDL